MNRPLVWVGIAYIAGEIWQLTGMPIWAGVLLLIMIFTTDRGRKQMTRSVFPAILAVFFLMGFIRYEQALCYPVSEYELQAADTVFTGKITAIKTGAQSVGYTLSDAQLQSTADRSGREIESSLIVYMDPANVPDVSVGDTITGSGLLELPKTATNPGEWDARSYYKAYGISYVLWTDEITCVQRGRSYQKWLQWLRQKGINAISRLYDAEDAGVLCAMLFGEKSLLDDAIRKLYQKAGIVHILAISGLHISLIGMAIYGLMMKVGLGFYLSACFSAFIVLSYGMMTGMPPSAERAVIMFILKMGAVYLGRTYDGITGIALSALLILWRYPLMLCQAGFLFSFVAVLGMLFLWPLIEGRLDYMKDKKNKDKKNQYKWVAAVGPSWTVTLLTMPLMAYFYGEIPLISAVLNLAIVPFAGILVPVALLSVFTCVISIKAALLMSGSAKCILWLNRWLCGQALSLPFSVWTTGSQPLWVLAVYYGVMAFFVAKIWHQERIRLRQFAMLAGCMVLLIPFRRLQSDVTFLDVGQGDCMVLHTPSVTYIVDCGSTTKTKVSERILLPYLKYHGITSVDGIWLSHADADHIGGIEEWLSDTDEQSVHIDNIYLPHLNKEKLVSEFADILQLAEKRAIAVRVVSQGNQLQAGDLTAKILWPIKDAEDIEDANSYSEVILWQYGDTSILSTGDISETQEQALDSFLPQHVTLLKAAHHGSKYSSSTEFLDHIKPQYAILSYGIGNRYGHPAEEAVERIKASGAGIYETGKQGAIVIKLK